MMSTLKQRHHQRGRDNYHHGSQMLNNNVTNLIERVIRREDDLERRLLAATQLRDAIHVMKSDTRTFIVKNMSYVISQLVDVFFERNESNLQKEVTKIISAIGHKFRNDPSDFFWCMLQQLKSIANDNVRNHLLDSIYKLLQMDLDENRKYTQVIAPVMDELKVRLENIDSAEHLFYCIRPLILIAQNYPVAFRKHFRDTVDILVGWHIDHSQKMRLTMFASGNFIKIYIKKSVIGFN